MKKIMNILLSLLMVITLVTPLHTIDVNAANAVASGNDSSSITWTFYDNGLLELKGSGDMVDHYDYGDHWPVPWKDYKSQITSLKIGEGITSVPTYAFDSYKNLKSISLPSSLKTIGISAFSNTAITSIYIPNGVTKIKGSAFAKTKLTSVSIPDSVEYIGSMAFDDCKELTTVKLPNGLTEMKSSMFRGCIKLKNITIPETVTTIENYVFNNCDGLLTLIIPAGVTTISDSAFSYADNLTLYVHKNSVAHNYAINKNLSYKTVYDSVKLSTTKETLYVGETVTLSPLLSPGDVTVPFSITLTSSNPSVATVNNETVVTAKGLGTATITVSVPGAQATCEIIVSSPITKVDLNKTSLSLYKGESYTLNAKVSPANTRDDQTIIWSSSNPNVAKVDSSGKITTYEAGTAIITATTSNGLTATCEVTVLSPITGVSLNKKSETIKINESFDLIATILPENTTDDKKLTWTSSNEDVATVLNGKVTAIAPGTTTITVTTSNGKTATCEIKVFEFGYIELPEVVTIYQGQRYKVPAYYEGEDVSDSPYLTWKAENNAIIGVDVQGWIYANNEGTTTLTVTTDSGYQATCTIIVENPITSVELDKTTLLMKKGESQIKLNAYFNGENVSDNETLIWKSSDSSIVYVDDCGWLVGVGNGTTTVSVTTSNGYTVTCEVTVYIPIESMDFVEPGETINVGESVYDNLMFEPYNATEPITWKSLDETIAIVDQDGKITGLKPGRVEIEAKALSGITAYSTIEVKQPISHVVLNQNELTLNLGTTIKLTATINPSDTTDKKDLTWTSSNPSVATVTTTGAVVTLAPGKTTITVETVNGKIDTCVVTVVKPITEIQMMDTVTLFVGESTWLTPKVLPNDTTLSKELTWESSEEGIVSIETNGCITGVNPGTTTITVTSVNGVKATCTVTVKDITSVELDHYELTLNKDHDDIQLQAFIDGISVGGSGLVTWESSNRNIVLVDGQGWIYAKDYGTADIIVTTINGKTAICTVKVEKPITSVEFAQENTPIYKGDTWQLAVYVYPFDTTYDKTLTWESSDESIATVDQNGNVTAVDAGVATIKVTTSNGITATCTVTVLSPITSVTLDKTELTLNKNESVQLNAVINPLNTTDDKTLLWQSNNVNVATVDQNGNVKATGVGTTEIYVYASSGVYAKCVVKVVSPITSVTLDTTSKTMNKGEEFELVATINPSDTTDSKKLTWTSSNSSIVTIDSNGKVTAVAPGTATIKVTTSNGKTATCQVRVLSPITSVTLDKISTTIKIGNYTQLIATINPSNTTDDQTLTWTSSNTSVAIVDENGKVFAIAPGTATITVTTSNGKTATCKVTVIAPITGVTLNKTVATINKGNTLQLTATINPSNTTDTKTLTWVSNNTNVATVDQNGKVTAIAPGTAIIIVQTSNGKTATCTVTVLSPITSVSLNSKEITVDKGNTAQLIATINPSDTTDNQSIEWTSSNPGIATVDQNGTVIAIAPGTTTITVKTSNGKTATCKVIVKSPIVGVTLDKSYTTVNKGKTLQLIATIDPNDTTDSKTLTWTSSNTKVATVDVNGKVTAVSAGTTIITVKTSNGKTATCQVQVKVPITSISLSETTKTMKVGEMTALSVTINPSDTTDDGMIKWTSNNPDVAYVDEIGRLIAVKEGTAIITAHSINGKTATCTVTVSNKNPITSIAVSHQTATIRMDQTLNIYAEVKPYDTTDDKSITWSSSDETIVQINQNGKLTPMSPGTATITITASNGVKATCTVTITPYPSSITKVTLNKTTETLTVGNSLTLKATVHNGNGTSEAVTWTSSNPNVATVDQNGKVTAKAVGSTIIKVTTLNGKTATCTITVTKTEEKLPFTDVNSKKWYYSYVKEAYELGLMTGTTNTTFAPDGNMTRGMVAVVMHRIAGTPTYSYRNIFPDVPAKKYCATAITWAFDNEIITGFKSGENAGKFLPDGNITRQDLALILYRYATSLGIDTSGRKDISTFVDHKEVSKYAREAMEWVTSVGIITGTKENELKPQANATRAECAKMLVEFYKLVEASK